MNGLVTSLRAALLVQKLHAAIHADSGPFAAAHRKILDLHAPYADDRSGKICQTCLEGSHLYGVVAYPCPTLLALAAAYGIEPAVQGTADVDRQ